MDHRHSLLLLTRFLCMGALLSSCLPLQQEAPTTASWQGPVDSLSCDLQQVQEDFRFCKTELDLLNERISHHGAEHAKMLQASASLATKQQGEVLKLHEQVTRECKSLHHLVQQQEEENKKLQEDLRLLSLQMKAQEKASEQVQAQIHAAIELLQESGKKEEKLHVVKSGDTLEKIAKAHSCSIEKLRQANQLQNDRILVGQKLILPS